MATRRRKRWLLVLAALALVASLGGWWINRQLEPDRMAATVLKKAGTALQLDLQFKGRPDYALKPEPRLVLPNFSARGADGKVFLSALRAEISLPWATLTGGEPVITRIELQQPVLDLPGLRRWLATRPKKPFELPTLSRGIAVSDGSVIDAGYRVNGLSLQLPHLETGDPAEVSARGNFARGDTTIPFELAARVATPGLASNFTLKASAELPARIAGARATTTGPAPIALSLDGHYTYAETTFTLTLPTLGLQATSPIPNLSGKALVVLDSQLSLSFDGVLASWPKTWPALPKPLSTNAEKLPVHVSYRGKRNLEDPLSLVMAREPTVLAISVRVPELQRWLDASDATPLPPLNGKLRTPVLVFDGVELQGVEVEMSDGDGDAAVP